MRNDSMATRACVQTNCGTCGKTCPANTVCSDGTCVCTTSFGDCNNDPADGCEAALLSETVSV
jgi:hypothetical protein